MNISSLDDLHFPMPDDFIVRPEQDQYFPFERQYRFSYWTISHTYTHAVSPYTGWGPEDIGLFDMEYWKEPAILTFIKHFNISFEEFWMIAEEEYQIRLRLGSNIADEQFEIPNPYLLFTFDVDIINDYYSLDPARNASARVRLLEWLQNSYPYESYSAFRAANPLGI